MLLPPLYHNIASIHLFYHSFAEKSIKKYGFLKNAIQTDRGFLFLKTLLILRSCQNKQNELPLFRENIKNDKKVCFVVVMCENMISNNRFLLYNLLVIMGKGRTVSIRGFACFRALGNRHLLLPAGR